MGKAFAQNAPTRSYSARKRWCAYAYMNWLLPSWVFYLSGAVGYVVIDMLFVLQAAVTDYQYNVLYAVMATIYVFDALFYFFAWLVTELEKRDHEQKIVQFDAAAWGEIMYVISAVFGLAAAGCAFMVTLDPSGNFAAAFSSLSALLAYGAMLWISNTLYLVDALVYWSAWYNKYVTTPPEDKESVCFDGYFWADGVLLTIPSLGYFITSFVVVFQVYVISINGAGLTVRELLAQYVAMLRICRAFNVVFDFFYVVDACVYAIAWLADAEVIKQLRIERGQDLPEMDLGESFRIVPRETQQN